MRLLFVCYANLCRSPTAEGIMRKLCRDSGRDDIEIASAGLHACLGDAPDPKAVSCAAVHGVDISQQRSRPFKMDDFKDNDLILVMSGGDREFLELRRPQGDEAFQRARIGNLASYADASAEVPNPYGTEGFENVYNLLEKACRGLLKNLIEK